jgi:hypothetical protein
MRPVGAKLQNATSDFFELDLSKNHSPVNGCHSYGPLMIQGVGMLSQDQPFDDRDVWSLLAVSRRQRHQESVLGVPLR